MPEDPVLGEAKEGFKLGLGITRAGVLTESAPPRVSERIEGTRVGERAGLLTLTLALTLTRTWLA